jgi:competence protein ComEA
LAWPANVQIALGISILAGLFFLLGRSSISSPQPVAALERDGPRLDLNRATKSELRLLPGVGDALALRVVEHRQRHGPFRSVDDLSQVTGFGPKTLERLRPWLFVALEPTGVEVSDAIEPAAKPRPAKRVDLASKKIDALHGEPIAVNRASQADLQKLPGIGPKLSQRILDERARGPFKSVEDLRRVPGIGAKTLERLRPLVTVEMDPPLLSSARR